jgi:pimeloyl-ACP methyl ester carboxylesterase
VRALLRDRFPIEDTVGSVPAPVIVVAGGADEIVPPARSRAVAAAAGAPYVEVPGARHNDPHLGHGPAVVDAAARAGTG